MFTHGIPAPMTRNWSTHKKLLWEAIASGGSSSTTSLRGPSPLSLTNAVKGKLRKLIQFGKVSVSDGVITCNNGTLSVVDGEIVTTGTAEEVTVTGANLLNSAVGFGGTNYYTVQSDGQIAVNSTDGRGWASVPVAVTLPAGAYTFSRSNGSGRVMARVSTDGYANDITLMLANALTTTITFTEETSIKFKVGLTAPSYPFTTAFWINLGSTALPYGPYSAQTVSDIPNLYAVDSLTDEHDIISGKTIRRTEAVISDGTTPRGRYIGTVGEGNVIVQARETVYEDDAVVSFEADEEKPLNLVKAEFSPVQDLHGQDAPWPAGGGKNKFPVADWYVAYDVSKNYLLVGDTSVFIPAGTYTLSFEYYNEDAPAWTSFWRLYSEQVTSADSTKQIGYGGLSLKNASSWTAKTVTFTTTQDGWFGLDDSQLRGGFHYRYIQLESGSSKTAFAPYSNICPIEGWTAIDIYNEPDYDPTATPKLTVTWQDEAGTVYGGYLRINRDGSVDLVGEDYTFTVDGTETYQTNYWGNMFVTKLANRPIVENGVVACSIAKSSATLPSARGGLCYAERTVATGDIAVGFGFTSVYASTDAFKTMLQGLVTSGTPATVSMKLATPVIYHLPSIDALKSYDGINNVWHSANGSLSVAVSDGDVIEQNTPHAITVEDGTNTVSWTAEVSGKEMAVEYRSAPTNSPVRALNILLNGNYENNGGPDDISDKEALEIIGGKK